MGMDQRLLWITLMILTKHLELEMALRDIVKVSGIQDVHDFIELPLAMTHAPLSGQNINPWIGIVGSGTTPMSVTKPHSSLNGYPVSKSRVVTVMLVRQRYLVVE